MTDEELITGLAKRDGKAVKYLYKEVRPSLLYTMTQWGATLEEAKDLFQEAIYAELKNRPKAVLELHTATYKTYLRSICWRQFLIICRRKKRTPNVTEDELTIQALEPEIYRQLEAMDYKKVVDTGMVKLREDCRKLIIQSLVWKWSYTKISKSLDLVEATARQRVHRCRNRLRQLIMDDPSFQELKQ